MKKTYVFLSGFIFLFSFSVGCKVSQSSGVEASDAMASNSASQQMTVVNTSYFPYPGKEGENKNLDKFGTCNPFAGKCTNGDFVEWKVKKEYHINKNNTQFPQHMHGYIPAWGPHTFHCTQFRAPDSKKFSELVQPGQPLYWKYYVGGSPQLGLQCGDVIVLDINGKKTRYLVTDYCPTNHAVQGVQAHCTTANIDVSLWGIREQLGYLDNTKGTAKYRVECRHGNGKGCSHLYGKLGKLGW